MVEFSVKTTLSNEIDQEEVRDVLSKALAREAKLAESKRAYFEGRCQHFEQTYEMTSDVFMQRFESGELGDDAAYFDWYAAKRGHDLWVKRARILSGVQI
jgi:hypothetical protein